MLPLLPYLDKLDCLLDLNLMCFSLPLSTLSVYIVVSSVWPCLQGPALCKPNMFLSLLYVVFRMSVEVDMYRTSYFAQIVLHIHLITKESTEMCDNDWMERLERCSSTRVRT